MTMTKPHLLFLDEPTNHLDIDAIDSLVKALKEFEGGLVIISHNQYIIEECCEQLWVVGDKTATRWENRFASSDFQDYKDYLIKLFEDE